MTLRSPEQIIGKDRLLQLIFEGYVVVPADPTPEMISVGVESMEPRAAHQHFAVENIYRRMCRVANGETAQERKDG